MGSAEGRSHANASVLGLTTKVCETVGSGRKVSSSSGRKMSMFRFPSLPHLRQQRKARLDRGVLDAITRALQRDHIGVVNDPIDHRRGDGGLTEHLAPPLERQIRGQDDRGLLVATRHQLEKQIRSIGELPPLQPTRSASTVVGIAG